MDPCRPERPIFRRRSVQPEPVGLGLPRIAPRLGRLGRHALVGEDVPDRYPAGGEDTGRVGASGQELAPQLADTGLDLDARFVVRRLEIALKFPQEADERPPCCRET